MTATQKTSTPAGSTAGASARLAGAPLTRVPELARETRTPVPRPTVGRLRLRPARRGRGFIVGAVDAAGPDTNGFAPRDRVAWRDSGEEELDELLLIDQDDVLGVPSWISDEQLVSYLGPGLIARALVRTRPFARGDQVRVVSTDPVVAELTAAWARSLGARIVEAATDTGSVATGSVATGSVATARVSIHDEPRVRRTVLGSHGKLAQSAVEVFQAIRAGVFDSVQTITGQLIAGSAPGIAA